MRKECWIVETELTVSQDDIDFDGALFNNIPLKSKNKKQWKTIIKNYFR